MAVLQPIPDLHGDTSGLTWWVSIKYDEGEGCWEKYPYPLASA